MIIHRVQIFRTGFLYQQAESPGNGRAGDPSQAAVVLHAVRAFFLKYQQA